MHDRDAVGGRQFIARPAPTLHNGGREVRPVNEVGLLGMRVASLTSSELIDHVLGSLAAGHGGWIITANLDFLRRYHRDRSVRGLYDAADLRVADGMPLVWASRWQGTPLPERVAGASLVPLLAQRFARARRSVYLLGGAPGAAEGAMKTLQRLAPDLHVAGLSSPILGEPPAPEELSAVTQRVAEARPDLLLVGMGSPKQERVCAEMRARFPSMWMMGVGHTFSFLAGQTPRAPSWMQRTGLEWVHRMITEPRRLARRYLVEDLPFAALLFAQATRERWTGPAERGGRSPGPPEKP